MVVPHKNGIPLTDEEAKELIKAGEDIELLPDSWDWGDQWRYYDDD